MTNGSQGARKKRRKIFNGGRKICTRDWEKVVGVSRPLDNHRDVSEFGEGGGHSRKAFAIYGGRKAPSWTLRRKVGVAKDG